MGSGRSVPPRLPQSLQGEVNLTPFQPPYHRGHGLLAAADAPFVTPVALRCFRPRSLFHSGKIPFRQESCMTMLAIRLSALGLVLSAGIVTAPALAQVSNHDAPGNLQSSHRRDCIALEEAGPVYTPADLYPAVAECVRKGEMSRAVDLFMLAGAYGRFDAFRVADRTAHQAMPVLQMQVGQRLDEGQRKSFMETLEREVAEPAAVARRCREIDRIGPPQYHPAYMIQHGMGAFTSASGGWPGARFRCRRGVGQDARRIPGVRGVILARCNDQGRRMLPVDRAPASIRATRRAPVRRFRTSAAPRGARPAPSRAWRAGSPRRCSG